MLALNVLVKGARDNTYRPYGLIKRLLRQSSHDELQLIHRLEHETMMEKSEVIRPHMPHLYQFFQTKFRKLSSIKTE